MILSKNIKINRKNIKIIQLTKLMELGYDISCDYIIVNTEDINKGSSVLVLVECDFCSKIIETTFNKYNCSVSNGGKYACSRKCSRKKANISNLEKYGVENVSQLESIKKKKEETTLKNYGVLHSLSSTKIKNDIKKSNLEKYGVENISQLESVKRKKEKTTLENYGVINPFQSKEIKENNKLINLGKYGVDNPMKSELIKDKVRLTNLNKYGVEYPLQSEEIKEKSKLTNLKRYGYNYHHMSNEFKENYKKNSMIKWGFDHPMKSDILKIDKINLNIKKWGVEHPMKSDIFRDHKFKLTRDLKYIKYIDNNISLFSCEKGHTFEINSDNYYHRIKSNIPLCTVCNPIGEQSSFKEKELLEYIKSIYSGEIISGYRDGLEIDIYLPELKLGFEFNGIYYHSSKFKDKNYHLNKSEYFREKGIRIIHIWEDDWSLRKEIIKSQINNLLGLNIKKIFARKCYVKEVYIKESKQFLDDNHIQGCVSSQIKIGLYIEDELVSIMTFNSSEGRKKMELGGWNLNRFCNLRNTNVIGGASKLLSYFVKNYEVNRIVSYADKDWSIGDLYYKLGFTNVGGNGPDYKYIVNNQRVHKSRYKKSKLNTTLTEAKQMEKDGFLKIYDCGKLKYEYLI